LTRFFKLFPININYFPPAFVLAQTLERQMRGSRVR